MATRTRNDESEPLMFSNAPTEVRDGRRYLTDDAARELADRVAKRYETLLEKLAQE